MADRMLELEIQSRIFSGITDSDLVWRLKYDGMTDPYVVAMVPLDNDDKTPYEHLTWEVDRELLARGVDNRAGEPGADVAIATWNDTVMIYLSSPDGACRVEFPLAPLRQFILDMYAEVPPNTEGEHVSWDNVIDRIIDWGKSGA